MGLVAPRAARFALGKVGGLAAASLVQATTVVSKRVAPSERLKGISVLPQNLNELTEEFFKRICAESWSESPRLEFKGKPPKLGDGGNHEFAKDISCLANTDGGDLVIGIGERDGNAFKIEPIPSGDLDSLKIRLTQILDSLVEPRIAGISLHVCDVDNGHILVIRVPASFEAPHSIRVNNTHRRFVMRNGVSTVDYSFDQLRAAFGRTASLVERATSFVQERRHVLGSGAGYRKLYPVPYGVFHAIPLAGLAGRISLDIAKIYNTTFTEFMGQAWAGDTRDLNFDGLLVHSRGTLMAEGYRQVYRNGSLEAVAMVGSKTQVNGTTVPMVFPNEVVNFFRTSLLRFLYQLSKNGEGPVVLGLSIMFAAGYKMDGPHTVFMSSQPVDRDHLHLPIEIIEANASLDVDRILRPLMDILWQGFALEACPCYDETGKFKLVRWPG